MPDGCDGMAKALIFATSFMTKKKYTPIAKYISRNAKTDIFDLKDLMTLNLDAYDTIIFGSANNGGKADKLVAEFVQNNTGVLAKKKEFLYVLISKDTEKEQTEAQAIAQELGVADVFCIPMKAEETNDSGFAVAIDDFIAKL
jgi:menaquinone-dependent protoporphyrinogen IX oxidase